MSARWTTLVLLVGLVTVGCTSSDTDTEAPTPEASGDETPAPTPDTSPTATADPAVAAAWEDMADRVELLAEQGAEQAGVLADAMADLSSEDMAEPGWFEVCCAGPRDDLLDTLEAVNAELDTAEDLAPRLSKSTEFVGMAREKADTAVQWLEGGFERHTTEAHAMAREGFPILFRNGIAGCVRACG